MGYKTLSRNKNKNTKLGLYPLSNVSQIALFIAYYKFVHKYSKRHYHLNFYELIVLFIVKAINAEGSNSGASMQDLTHYMSWHVAKKGNYYANRLIEEGWLRQSDNLPARQGVNYSLFLTLKCVKALDDIERFVEVLLSTKPPKRLPGKYTPPRKPGNSGLLTGYLRGKKKPKGFDDGIEYVGHS